MIFESVSVDNNKLVISYFKNDLLLINNWYKNVIEPVSHIIDNNVKIKYDASKVKEILKIANEFSRKHNLGIKFADIIDIDVDTDSNLLPFITWKIEPNNTRGPEMIKEQQSNPNYLPISTRVGSSDDKLFTNIVNKGIDSHLEGFTQSKFSVKNTSIGKRRIYNFHKSELPILIRRLKEEGSDIAMSWANDIEDSMNKKNYFELEESIRKKIRKILIENYKSDKDIENEFRSPKVVEIQHPISLNSKNQDIGQIVVEFPLAGESVAGGSHEAVETFSFDPKTRNGLWFKTNHYYPDYTYNWMRGEIIKFLHRKYHLSMQDDIKMKKGNDYYAQQNNKLKNGSNWSFIRR